MKREGVFDRKLAASNKKVDETDGFMDFCPSTEQGRQRWVQLQEMFVMFFRVSANRQLCEDNRREVLNSLWVKAAVSDYIPNEQEAYTDFCDVGGQISEATRVEISKAKFGIKLKAGYDLYVQTEACKHGPDELLGKGWSRFITVLEKVGRPAGSKMLEVADEFGVCLNFLEHGG